MGFKIFIITVVLSLCCPFSRANNIQRESGKEESNALPDDFMDIPGKDEITDPEYYKYIMDEIKFWYYPGQWDDDYSELLQYNSTSSLESSSLQKDKPYKILIHGYLESGRTAFSTALVKAYRNKMEAVRTGRDRDPQFRPMNIIAVDWSAISGNQKDRNYQEYDRIVPILPNIGERVADFILCLKKFGYVKTLDDVHCIGHSLGAHICGQTGKYIQKKTVGESLARITGLDPAGPLITPEIHLRKEFAKFVDAIHTDFNISSITLKRGDNVYTSGIALGSDVQCGHVDFYPNGGSERFLSLFSIKHPCYWKRMLPGVDHVCMHNYAYAAYALSISNPRGSMKGYKCANFLVYTSPAGYVCKWSSPSANFGEYIDTNAQPGEYYLAIDRFGNAN